MAKKPLRAVLIGAGGFGAHALEAMARCELLELVGVSDRDAAVAGAAAAQAGVEAFADNRRALVEPQPDVAFLAVPPPAAAEIIRLAASRSVHVWTQAPLARNLADAVEICRATRRAEVMLAVGAHRRFARGYRKAMEHVGRLGEVYLVEGSYLFNWGGPLGWRGDASAGGGAMRQLGYHVVDLIGGLLGVPETVYCITATGQRAAHGHAVYDTDDTASALLRYTGAASATVTVSRCFSPVREGLAVYGRGGSILAGPDRCVLRDRDGAVLESFESDELPAAAAARQVEAFARAVADRAAHYECSGWENLPTAATVEAAYLSARTGQSESPAAMLAGYGIDQADWLAFAPRQGNDHEAQPR